MIQKNKKKAISFILVALSLFLICSVLVSCSSALKLKFEGGALVAKNGAASYKPAPLAYKPVGYLAEEEYAVCDHPIFGNTPYFSVAGTNGDWIYCEKDDTLYHLSSIETPTLAQMKSGSAIVSTTGNKQIALGTLEDKNVISRLTAAIILGENASVADPIVPPMESYHVSFRSEIYSFLVYSVFYYEYEDGSFLIYDADSGLFFEAGSEIHEIVEGFFDKGNAETDAQ